MVPISKIQELIENYNQERSQVKDLLSAAKMPTEKSWLNAQTFMLTCGTMLNTLPVIASGPNNSCDLVYKADKIELIFNCSKVGDFTFYGDAGKSFEIKGFFDLRAQL